MRRIRDRIAMVLILGMLIVGVGQIIGSKVDHWISTTFAPPAQTVQVVESP